MTDTNIPAPHSLCAVPDTARLPPIGYGPVNWRGLFALTCKETRRFLKISTQTLLAPVVTTLLFYAVFRLTFGSLQHVASLPTSEAQARIGTVPFMDFLIPGLIMMSITQNSFFNTSSALILAKIQGHLVDLLLAPISPFECVLAFVLSGIIRGFLVGGLTIAAIWAITPMSLFDVGYVVYHGTMAAMMLSLLGLLTGIWAEKFEQMATVQNVIVLPATFMSGTFFSISALPSPWREISFFNPFFYMIDGFRYGFTGHADGSLSLGLFVMLFLNAGLFLLAQHSVASGKNLKS